ncbi:Hypothetical predicted protein [Podarcis lilfordi]|uniref:Uncharacterized protein n=1 Tax=Podarcis lilfordi TaxID=74358 RepID=A0AA35KXS9_9SAUR|nr:Hypothetical predicted protein [Podarcis lilfordi]
MQAEAASVAAAVAVAAGVARLEFPKMRTEGRWGDRPATAIEQGRLQPCHVLTQ